MNKQSLIKGSLILACAGILAKFLGLFFRWPLIMLIGDEGLGYYQMTYPLYMLFIAISAGVPTAVSKLVSEKNAVGNREEVFQVIKEALKVMIFLGIGMTLFFSVCGKWIINILQWDPKAYYSIIGISLAPLFIGIMTPLRGFFQGLQNMTPTATSQIIEQIGRVSFGVGLAFLFFPLGIEYSAGGAAFGAVAGGLFSTIYLLPKYRKIKKEFKIKKIKSNNKIFNEIIKVALPISIGAAVGSIMGVIDSILVPQKLLESGLSSQNSTILYAQLTGKATVFTNIPMTLAVSLSASIIPIISELYTLKNRKQLDNKINMAMKLCMLVAIPCFLGLFFMAEPIMKLIFPGKSEGFIILKYLAISVPFLVTTHITTSILQGTKYYYRPVINLMIGCFIKVLLTIILVPIKNINIYGAVIATIIAYLVVSILNVIHMEKKLNYKLQYMNFFVKPLIASLGMICAVMLFYNNIIKISSSNGLSCLISILVGIIIYVVLILVLKIIEYDDIKRKVLIKVKKRI
ncbi:putative polysaccharide biosynthesis protein [Clostridium tarantellae]|uniref:Oligosaccharide flippase family protein n=1 Tax=Clostridium tarantellae TaxID=39493 RepID=A0A6I1MG57_9CLOT|nr:polysaccharide biosynthesis protein [Clostridium tarantellae]MPQ42170.1 oligosaccharide flippase family protein [Clostridium tarantellae]